VPRVRDYRAELLAALERSPRALCQAELLRAIRAAGNVSALLELRRLVREGRVRAAEVNGRRYYYVRDDQAVADTVGMGDLQREVLALLLREGAARVSQIARELGRHPSSVSRAIQGLVRRGLVRWSVVRRAYALTPEGEVVALVLQ